MIKNDFDKICVATGENNIFGIHANCKDLDQPSDTYSLIRNFAILRYALQYQMNL